VAKLLIRVKNIYQRPLYTRTTYIERAGQAPPGTAHLGLTQFPDAEQKASSQRRVPVGPEQNSVEVHSESTVQVIAAESEEGKASEGVEMKANTTRVNMCL